jgi:hypothetical protein
MILMVAAPLWGQSGAATQLSGKISDPQGAAVPGATLSLLNLGTQNTREGFTDDQGSYLFVQLPPGTYQLKIEMPGFKTMIRERVVLQVNTPRTLDLTLELGEISEVVNVYSERISLNRTDATVGNPFEETQIKQLPLLTRNIVRLLTLQPGVTSSPDQEGQVAGGRNDQNNVTLDGADVNDQQTSGAFESVLPIPIDSVQEFRVTTVGTNANQGRSGGGQVSLVTKSGTQEWHGSLYEFHRNTVTAANSFFNNKAGVEREALIRNQYGFSIGGPIIKDRAFFFFNWEQRLDRSGQTQLRTIPTDAVINGNLVFKDNDGTVWTADKEAMKIVDPAGIGVSDAMLAYWSNFPRCGINERGGGCDPDEGPYDRGLSFTGFRFNAPLQRDDKAYVARFDFNITEDGNHTASWRGTLADNGRDTALSWFPGQGPRSQTLNNSRGFSANYTAVLSSTLTNSFTWGFTRQGFESTGIR